MSTAQTLSTIELGRIIAIIRGDFRASIQPIVQAMLDGGVSAVEVTLNSPGAMSSIRELADAFGDRMAIGAGTVLKPDEVSRVADAGGTFIVSPNRNVNVIAKTKTLGLASIPGCFTPSEMIEALDAGADALKLFPASSLGVDFVKNVRGPFGSSVRLVPTGGIGAHNAADYARVGAWAIGIGSELVRPDSGSPEGLIRVRENAAKLVAAMKKE
jgi:Entner-Doudoroff aldolase